MRILYVSILLLLPVQFSAQALSHYFSRNFGLANATLNGHVYADTNGNGTQDTTEADLPNVNMIILQSNGGVQAVITDANGDWTAIVPEGLTNVFLDNNDLPAGYLLTEGTDPTAVVAIANQPNYAGTDGIHFRGILSGHLYFDDNGNGSQNTGEAALPNVDIRLTDSYGTIQTVTTDANGNWSASLAETQVEVLVVNTDPDFPIGATQTEGTNPTLHNVILSVNTFTENEGFFKSGWLSGHLYHDSNNNGTQNINEPNMANVEVLITLSNGSTVSVITDANGNWSILAPIGNTVIQINTSDTDFPTGATQTQGTNPQVLTVFNGQDIASIPCGFYSVGTLSGHLYYDFNNNGIQDSGELNMANISVYVTDSAGNNYALVTDSNGNWSVTTSVGNATSVFDVNDVDLITNFVQTEGTNPTTTFVMGNQTTLSDNDGLFSGYDFDGDGLTDLVEIANGTNFRDPCDPYQAQNYTGYDVNNFIWAESDCDGDGLTNGNEAALGSSPYNPCDPNQEESYGGYDSANTHWANADCDADGLTNGLEVSIGTQPYNPDTDGDGIADGAEHNNSTDPNDPCNPIQNSGYTGYVSTNILWQTSDCDGDGYTNETEHNQGSDPYDPCSPQNNSNTNFVITNPIWQNSDCDGDGLTNGQEYNLGTNPYNDDTDGDGLSDSYEVSHSTNPLVPCDPVQALGYTGYDAINTIWQAADCDGDGITNGIEHLASTDPYNPCSPLPASTYTGFNASSPIWQAADCDSDGLTNGQENTLGTNPYYTDTDGDGLTDGYEVSHTTNPLDPCDPTHSEGYTGYDANNPMWQVADCDGDGVSNGSEATHNTDPYSPCDPPQNSGYTDYDASNPIWVVADCDQDGIPNNVEVIQQTDPYNANQDGMTIYNALTPNGDAQNDIFYIKNIEYLPQNSVKIYNRWGVLVFETEQYNNTTHAFKGISEGRITIAPNQKLPVGTYYYTLEYTTPTGVQRTWNGYLYIN